jgi:hypothetical protein
MRLSCHLASPLLAAVLLASGCARPNAPVAGSTPNIGRSEAQMKPAPGERAHVATTRPVVLESQTADAEVAPRAASLSKVSVVRRPLVDIDESRAAAAGIRKLNGRHLVLFTDVAAESSIEELPAVFDAAFPQWCEHLGLDSTANAGWQMRGFLVKDQARFEAVGLWPDDLPQFLNGYTRGREFWLYNQSSEYYRRHLMLHEGVHGIMFSLQRSSGPAWYMEGVAELLATHCWLDRKLTLPYFPVSAAEVPKLGRIEIVQTQFKAGNAKYLRDVLALENRHYLENEPYAWSWTAAAFLYGHPAYRDRFRAMLKERARGELNDQLKEVYAEDARQLGEEWQVFIGELAHGYDFERTRLDFAPAKMPLEANKPAKVSISADRGWQNTGLRLEAGKQYKLTAAGRYTLAKVPAPWTSEPGGVTIRYHRGMPLGIVLAVVRPQEAAAGPSPFFNPQVIGLGATIGPRQTGTLYLRINDFAGELADNSGAAEVSVTVGGTP